VKIKENTVKLSGAGLRFFEQFDGRDVIILPSRGWVYATGSAHTSFSLKKDGAAYSFVFSKRFSREDFQAHYVSEGRCDLW
jgi:hypothetical protein